MSAPHPTRATRERLAELVKSLPDGPGQDWRRADEVRAIAARLGVTTRSVYRAAQRARQGRPLKPRTRKEQG